MKTTVAMFVALAAPIAAVGQTPATTAVDPARLAAARALIDVLIPPAAREQMIQGMIAPMQANMRRGLEENPEFAAEMRGDPRAKAIFDRFMVRQEARTRDILRQSLPGMVPAMAAAYARRFTVAQMQDIRTFFETSTGRVYLQEAFTMMSDPDVQAWQRRMMTQTLAEVQKDAAAVVTEIAALRPKTP